MNRARRLAIAMANSQVKLLAVDFDRTIVSVHTRGNWRGSPKALAQEVRPFFRDFFVAAQDLGIWVAIVSFSTQAQLIADCVAIALNGRVERIYLRCADGSWNVSMHRARGTDFEGCDLTLKGGKIGHIFSVVCDIKNRSGLKINLNDCLYLDDDLRNIENARLAGMFHSGWFPATFEPQSADRIVWRELEGYYLENKPWEILATSSDIVSKNATTNPRSSLMCFIL